MTWWTWTTFVFCSICLFLCQTNITGIWLKKLMRCWWWSGQAAQSAFETSAIIISLLYINHQHWTAAPLFFATFMFQNSSWSQFYIQLVNKVHFGSPRVSMATQIVKIICNLDLVTLLTSTKTVTKSYNVTKLNAFL